jgi:hypothetical protein
VFFFPKKFQETSWTNAQSTSSEDTDDITSTHPRQKLYFVKACINSNCSAVSAMLKDGKAPEIRRVTLLIPVSVHQAWCSLRVSVVALLSRGTCACLLTPELVRRSPPKHLPPALLCAACAPPCQSALSPWRICKRFARARPHCDSRMDQLLHCPLHRPVLFCGTGRPLHGPKCFRGVSFLIETNTPDGRGRSCRQR